MPDFSIVIPCRNESARLPATLPKIGRFLDAGESSAEVIVVVEKSQDGTLDVARAWAAADNRFRILESPEARGKGHAVKTGMLAASGGTIFFMDADLSVPLRFIPSFLAAISCGADVALGSRRHPESLISRRQPLRRILAGRAFNLGLRLCGATRLKDTQCGFKAFCGEAAREIFSRASVEGFGFDVEILALAERLGYRVAELPIEWRDSPGSKVRALRDGFQAFRDALTAVRRVRGMSPAVRSIDPD